MEESKSKRHIFKYICLVAYIICGVFLIAEASMDGTSSSEQSNVIGESIANFVNNLLGDQTVVVEPTSLKITNKISNASVGDSYQINTLTEPENATYKAIEYKTSDESVAHINSQGMITFKKQGEVTISCNNEKKKDIKDEMRVKVNNVEASDIEISIPSAVKDSKGVYCLYVGQDYSVSTSFTPINTTFKEVTYSLDSSYAEISSQGVITPLKHSFNNVITLEVTHKLIKKEIQFKTCFESITDLVSIQTQDISICEGELAGPDLSFLPVNASYQDVSLESQNEDVAIIEGNKIRGLKEGETTIDVRSTVYFDVFNTFKVTILKAPLITSFSASINEDVALGKTKSIIIENVTPKNGSLNSLTYTSLNPSIATVDSSGIIKGISEGSATIRIEGEQCSYDLSINVYNPIDTVTTDYEINIKDEYLSIDTQYDLNEIFEVSFMPSTPSSALLNYALRDKTRGVINDSILTINEIGTCEIEITHVPSGISHIVSLYAYESFSLSLNNDEAIALKVNEEQQFEIISNQESNQEYIITETNLENAVLSKSDDIYNVLATSKGLYTITIAPFIDGIIYQEVKEQITFDIDYTYVSSLSFKAHYKDSSEEIEIKDSSLDIFNNQQVILAPLYNEGAISQFVYQNNNPENYSVDNLGRITTKKAGRCTLLIKEQYSNIEVTLTLNIYNKILISSTPFAIEGDFVEFKEDNNVYLITNGHSASAKVNFETSSTYKEARYVSSDEEILSVGKDGILTPHKVGKAKVTFIIDDGMSSKKEFVAEIEVIKQTLIQDLNEFFGQIRKGIGHFGAFMVFGVFSTLTYMLFLIDKKTYIPVGINLSQGFVLACLTELIQLMIPGRAGTFVDVMIDFLGFMITVTVVTLIFVIKKLKNKKGLIKP